MSVCDIDILALSPKISYDEKRYQFVLEFEEADCCYETTVKLRINRNRIGELIELLQNAERSRKEQ